MEDLSNSKADFKWLVLDACRNKPFRQYVEGARLIQKIDNPPKGIALFQSCTQNEYSYDDENAELGLFTSNFVKGIQGAANSNNDGVLTFLEVCTYTTSQTVSDVKQKFRRNQRPYLSGNIPDFVLIEDLNRLKAEALFAEAQKLFTEEDYETAKTKIDEAMEMSPKEQKYAHLCGKIDRFLKNQQENERLAREKAAAERKAKEEAERKAKEEAKAEAERKAKEEAELAQRQQQTVPTPVSLPRVGRVSVTSGDVSLPPEFNPNPRQYEKFWEQKGITGSIALSRDGKRLAVTCGNDIKILDFSTGEVLQTLKGHPDLVNSVSYSPVGRFIASGSWDYTVRIWNVQTGECMKTILKHTYNVKSVSYSPDGRFIASGSSITVYIWNAQTGECVKTIKHENDICSVSYSPDGRFIASGSSDNTIRIWDAQTGECVKTLEGQKADVSCVSFSPDGRFIASGGEYSDKTVRIWNVQTGECVKTLEGHKHSVRSVSYSPDGRFIASGSADKTVLIWNVHTGECVKTIKWCGGYSVSYSPDGQFIATGSYKTICLLNVQTGECVKTILEDMWNANSVSYSPDGKYISVGAR